MISKRAIVSFVLGMTTALVVSAPVFAQIANPIPDPLVKGNIRIELEPVLTGIVAPNMLTHSGDGSGRLFVVDQPGQIRLINNGVPQAQPYLDLSSLLVPLNAGFDERGFLGLAFHPDFAQTGEDGFGKFYTYTSEPTGNPADFTVPLPVGASFNHQSVIREWTVDPADNVITGDLNTLSRVLMRVDEPQGNHNAGMLAFGPGRNLHISFGDGGGGNDNDDGHTNGVGNGQDKTNVLGTILRINPLGNNSSNGQYGIPGDNPFLAEGSTPDEIYAYGLRNPFRFSFDTDPATGQVTGSTTGNLIVGDVGQGKLEEIDIVSSGDNLGWRLKEGTFFFNEATTEVDDEPWPAYPIPAGFDPVDPVIQYDHDEGIAVIGGFVYNGSEVQGLTRKYVFGDLSAGSGQPGRLFVGDLATGEISELVIGLDDRSLGKFLKGIGQDADGELYVLVGSGFGPTGSSGEVLRIVQLPEPAAAALAWWAAALALACRRRRG